MSLFKSVVTFQLKLVHHVTLMIIVLYYLCVCDLFVQSYQIDASSRGRSRQLVTNQNHRYRKHVQNNLQHSHVTNNHENVNSRYGRCKYIILLNNTFFIKLTNMSTGLEKFTS